MKTKSVYIVHCVDTEGPMYESLKESFVRIESIFGVKVKPTYENLELLRNKKIKIDGNEEMVSELLSPKKLNMNTNWCEIDTMLDKIRSSNFRNKLLDSNGQGWVYSWFCLDHVGFSGKNPRKRDSGHHKVFDHYVGKLSELNSRDIIQWHYHPVSGNGNYNSSGVTYLNSSNVWEILSRKIIDRFWFPSVYRPGFHCERPDSHWFLEQWMPFDYGNQSMTRDVQCHPDMSNGRYGDWNRAPTKWGAYHPHHDDYQSTGTCKRSIFRCLNMEARIREINESDIRDGFIQAKKGETAVISFTNHDFRDMELEIEKVRGIIEKVSKDFSDVKFFFVDALTAAREYLDLTPSSPDMQFSIEKHLNKSVIHIVSHGELFGSQPYLAIKTKDGRYLWENFDYHDGSSWSFTFDYNSLELELVEKIGIASNSISGVSQIIVYNVSDDSVMTKTYQ